MRFTSSLSRNASRSSISRSTSALAMFRSRSRRSSIIWINSDYGKIGICKTKQLHAGESTFVALASLAGTDEVDPQVQMRTGLHKLHEPQGTQVLL